MSAYLYIVVCRDGKFYVGTTRGSLERRSAAHDMGHYGGYTSSRLPVKLVFSQRLDRIADAIAVERQVKGWTMAKKQALIDGDFGRLKLLAKSHRSKGPHGEPVEP